ncbi:helix-turn-helix domain-containing protein [Megalodesulfovibrio gigas]|uniref:helix-turn-helix domain-containing protein n=1 Tax=Megalodesulfovibrio gigas TaxID=879 RepID=UPI0003F5B4E1|nr:helix-turn-helix transcriptional regulator [Megalodesulfovibrio gigas]
MTRTTVAGMLGLAAFFVFEYVCYSAGRAYAGMAQPIEWMLGANLAGVLVAGALDGVALPLRTGRWRKGVAVTLAMLGAAACLLGEQAETPTRAQVLFCLGSVCAGMQLPGLLRGFFQAVPRRRQGLMMGLALAAAEVFWIFLLMRPPGDGFALGLYLAAAQLCLGLAALLRTDHEIEPAQQIPMDTSPPAQIRKTLLYLAGITAVFFVLDSFLDVLFFRYDKVDSPIPREIGLYIWLAYPLTGLLLDKKGFGVVTFLTFLAFCLVSPALTATSQSTPMYWVVFSMDIIGRHGAFLFTTVVAAHLARTLRWNGMMRCLPYLLQHGAYLGVLIFVEVFHPGTACILLVSLFLCCTFSHLSLKVHYVVAMAGYSETRVESAVPVPGNDATAVGCVLAVPRLAWFVDKYGLTPREKEVLELIMLGTGSQAMGERLFISEHTVKTHIRNLLRKTNTPSRSALMALFINERMDG